MMFMFWPFGKKMFMFWPFGLSPIIFSIFVHFTFCGMTVHFFVTSLSANIFLISFEEIRGLHHG